jgi:hypothetical protein
MSCKSNGSQVQATDTLGKEENMKKRIMLSLTLTSSLLLSVGGDSCCNAIDRHQEPFERKTEV